MWKIKNIVLYACIYICIYKFRCIFLPAFAFMHISHNTFGVGQRRLNHPKSGSSRKRRTGTSPFAVSLPLKLGLTHQRQQQQHHSSAWGASGTQLQTPAPTLEPTPTQHPVHLPTYTHRVDLCSEFAFIYHYTWKHFRFVPFIMYICSCIDDGGARVAAEDEQKGNTFNASYVSYFADCCCFLLQLPNGLLIINVSAWRIATSKQNASILILHYTHSQLWLVLIFIEIKYIWIPWKNAW